MFTLYSQYRNPASVTIKVYIPVTVSMSNAYQEGVYHETDNEKNDSISRIMLHDLAQSACGGIERKSGRG